MKPSTADNRVTINQRVPELCNRINQSVIVRLTRVCWKPSDEGPVAAETNDPCSSTLWGRRSLVYLSSVTSWTPSRLAKDRVHSVMSHHCPRGLVHFISSSAPPPPRQLLMDVRSPS